MHWHIGAIIPKRIHMLLQVREVLKFLVKFILKLS